MLKQSESAGSRFMHASIKHKQGNIAERQDRVRTQRPTCGPACFGDRRTILLLFLFNQRYTHKVMVTDTITPRTVH